MDVKVLGAANEVGRSGFLVNCNGTNLLLDYGVMFGRRGSPPQYPTHVKPKDIDSVIITHAHLDHSGYVPALFASGHCNVYATPPTFELTRLLVNDMLKIEKNIDKMLLDAKKKERKKMVLKNSRYSAQLISIL